MDISDASPAATAAGTLHVLAVGITTYRDATFSLRVAAADAEALAAALKGPLGCYFHTVDSIAAAIGKTTSPPSSTRWKNCTARPRSSIRP